MYLTVEFPEGLEFVSATTSSPLNTYESGSVYWGQVFSKDQSTSIKLPNGTPVSAGPGAYWLMIGAGYSDDPLAAVGSTETITLIAKVIKAIEDGDLELTATGTLITGPQSSGSVVVYAPAAPEEPPIIVVDPDPVVPNPTDPDPDPIPDIPDPDVPLVETPDVEVPEEDVPLAEEPEVEIPEENVPLAEEPEVEIPEEDVPLADVPQTGDIFTLWYLTTLLSACGLAVLNLFRKKDRG